MKKKYIQMLMWPAVAISLVLLLWWTGSIQASKLADSSDSAVAPAANGLVADNFLYDFGTISMANGKVSTIFEVTNPTRNDILVESLTTSCMCTSAFIIKGENKKGPYGMPGHGQVPKANETIKAGETRFIEVVYDPNAHGPAGVGSIDRFIFLDDENGGRLALEIKAQVTP